MSNFQDDIEKFNGATEDLGKKPATRELSNQEKQLAAVAMAINATLIKLVGEGAVGPEQQMHFMLHFGDYLNRLTNGEDLVMLGANQTLNVNTEIARFFADAMDYYSKHGSETFVKAQSLARDMAEAAKASENSNGEQNVETKHTLH